MSSSFVNRGAAAKASAGAKNASVAESAGRIARDWRSLARLVGAVSPSERRDIDGETSTNKLERYLLAAMLLSYTPCGKGTHARAPAAARAPELLAFELLER